MSAPFVEHIECKTAKEFLDGISPRGDHFGKHQRFERAWVFRGHGDDSYELVPNALRMSVQKLLNKIAGLYDKTDSNRNQAIAEMTVLEKFVVLCDEKGILVPNNGPALERVLKHDHERFRRGGGLLSDWPKEDAVPALCLAQHHGLPTRLLDWTFSPYIAAFFAALDGSKRLKRHRGQNVIHGSQYISVWALQTASAYAMGPMLSLNEPHLRAEFINPPRRDNLYLMAQEGLFTLCRIGAFDEEVDGERTETNAPDRRSLNVQMEEKAGGKRMPSFSLPAFVHFTLPVSEAFECLRGLEKESMTSSTIYPDYSGVVKTIFDLIDLDEDLSQLE